MLEKHVRTREFGQEAIDEWKLNPALDPARLGSTSPTGPAPSGDLKRRLPFRKRLNTGTVDILSSSLILG